jgi:hypothetical protein
MHFLVWQEGCMGMAVVAACGEASPGSVGDGAVKGGVMHGHACGRKAAWASVERLHPVGLSEMAPLDVHSWRLTRQRRGWRRQVRGRAARRGR